MQAQEVGNFTQHQGSHGDFTVIEKLALPIDNRSVSYTHLDVYKRQGELRGKLVAAFVGLCRIGQACEQFGLVHARAQALLKQAINPSGVSRWKLFNALGKVHQFVGVEWCLIIHIGVHGW